MSKKIHLITTAKMVNSIIKAQSKNLLVLTFLFSSTFSFSQTNSPFQFTNKYHRKEIKLYDKPTKIFTLNINYVQFDKGALSIGITKYYNDANITPNHTLNLGYNFFKRINHINYLLAYNYLFVSVGCDSYLYFDSSAYNVGLRPIVGIDLKIARFFFGPVFLINYSFSDHINMWQFSCGASYPISGRW